MTCVKTERAINVWLERVRLIGHIMGPSLHVHNLLALGPLGLALNVHLRVFIEIGLSYRETIKRNEKKAGTKSKCSFLQKWPS